MAWRIMVVDDEEDIRLILKSALSDEFEVVEAMNGLDALEKLDRVEPDFICMDVMMPLMNGFEACEAIRRDPNYHDVPVMFLTALAGKEDIKKGYGKGANLYLTKPFEPERLVKNIKIHFGANAAAAREKRYSLKELEEFDENGAEPIVPGARELIAPEPALQASVTPAPLPPAKDLENARPRLMIVDDDEDIIKMMDATLRGRVETVWATDGMQAIERLVRWQPDVIIIDIMLPKMSGFQLCQTLRANPAFKRLPILVCSAKCREKDVEFARRSGANDFLAKPFKPDELVARVDALTRSADFRVRLPKSLTHQQIMKTLKPEKSDVFEGEADALKERVRKLAEAARDTEEGKPRPIEDDLSTSSSRVKRFFGIGKKK